MWLLSTSWRHQVGTPAAERLEEVGSAVTEFVEGCSARQAWYQPREGHVPDSDEVVQWGEAVEAAGSPCKVTVRSRRVEPSAEVTFTDCDPRNGWAGSLHARIVVPEGDAHQSRWGELLERVATGCRTSEVVALKALDLVAWEPGPDGFAPGRYTYLTRGSTRHPRMERLGFKTVSLNRGTLYVAPARSDAELLERLQLWARL